MTEVEVKLMTYDNGMTYGFICINKYDCDRFNEHFEEPEPDTSPLCICHYLEEGKYEPSTVRCGAFKGIHYVGTRLMAKCNI